MNKNSVFSALSFGLTVGLLMSVSTSNAQTETVTTSKTTTYSGTVSEINPATSTIILRSESSPAPVTYSYTKETTFVDANGNVVSSETIRNSPVRVEYSDEGGRTVVRRVIQTGPSVMAPGVVVTPSVPGVVVTPPAAPTMRKETTRTETETR